MSSNKTTKNLDSKIKGVIIESLHSILGDPEFGEELQDWVKRRLEKYKNEKDFSRHIPAEKIN